MSPVELGVILFFLMLALILLGVHVSFVLIFLGFLGLSAVVGLKPALSSLAIISLERTTDYNFATIPLFLLMGAFVSRTEIAREAYETARVWIGQLRGGLAMATSLACGLFAACCGSSLATALAMGKIAYPEMERYRYDPKLSTGIIIAGGTIGILIPPSIGFIVIGILTQLSIGKLFIAGIIPGILEVIFYALTVYVLCRLRPELGPASPPTSLRQKFGALRQTGPIMLLFLLVIGGIYGGIFTPAEAGGIGAFGALILGIFRRQLNLSSFFASLKDTARSSAIIIALILGAFIFNQFLAVTRIPFLASEWIVGLGTNRYVILCLILIMYIILGMFLDVMAILVLTLPIIFPTMVRLGFDPIWYSVIMVRIVEVGMITPPFGINIFGLAGVVNVPMGTLYRSVFPFVIADLLHILLLILVPSLCTFLPEMMIAK